MYGAIGRLCIKAAMEGQFRQLIEGQAPAFDAGQVPGFEVSYACRIETDPKERSLP